MFAQKRHAGRLREAATAVGAPRDGGGEAGAVARYTCPSATRTLDCVAQLVEQVAFNL